MAFSASRQIHQPAAARSGQYTGATLRICIGKSKCRVGAGENTMWGVIDAQYNGWRCLVRKGTLTRRPGRHIVPGCTIDAGSSLTHGTASPAVSCPHKRECPFLPSRPAIPISLLPERRGWAWRAIGQGRPVEPPTRPLAGPIDRGARARLLMSPLTCRADRILSFPGPRSSNQVGIASQTIRETVLRRRHIARCGDTAHPVCGCARAAASQ